MAQDGAHFLRERDGEHGQTYFKEFESKPHNEHEAENRARNMKPDVEGDIPTGFTYDGVFTPLK